MMNVSREDVLINAVHKLDGFQKTGESDQAAAERLVRSLERGPLRGLRTSSRSARGPRTADGSRLPMRVTAAYL
jgi:hypothetical protein